MEIDQKHPYHSISAEETLEKVSASKEGLSGDEAQKRQEEFGRNVLPEKGGTNPIMLFLKQFKDFLVLILIIAAGIAWWADQMADVYIILAVILFNAIMGFTQEYKAEKAIQSIKSMIEKKAMVLRDGKEKQIDAEEVVPGDIIILSEGESVPADARLLKAKELRTEEASLTGESMPIDKEIDPVEEDAPIGDRTNMVWKGTNVAKGSGKAVVTAIGEQTEIGKIATSMGEMEMQDSNFKRKTGQLGKQMAFIAIGTSAVVFALGYWYRDFEFQQILLVTIATLVSSIPEGLPAVISIVLAIGANRMAKQNVIIREFTATEMMGSVSTILSDKTGTITQSILTVKKTFTGSGQELAVTGAGYQLQGEFKKEDENIELDDNPVESKLMAIAAFCNNASLQGEEEQEQKQKKEEKKEGEKKKDQEKKKEEKEKKDKEKEEKKKDEGPKKTKKETDEIKEETPEAEKEDQEMDVDVDVEEDRVRINVHLKKEEKKKKGPNDIEEEEEEEEFFEEEEEEEEKKEEGDDDDDDNEQDQGPKVTGDPTEAAMFVMARKAQIKQKEPYSNYQLLDDLPFNSEQKFRASLVDTEDGPEIFAIGAPERILELSTKWLTPDGPEELDDEKKEKIRGKMDQWTGEAMRVLAQGYKKADGKDSINADDVQDLIWVGITGIIDPPRKGVKESIDECKTAGVRVMMVTGDHKRTAAAIAEQVGIVESKEEKEGSKYPVSISSKELDVEDEKFDDLIQNVNVFARVDPQTKLRIAERLQAGDTLIAMTGDGVNDAPALKRADVGIAMGQRGTDVAKDASEIVLQDDNFSSIVNAIREGRIVFNNVRITSYFLLTTNFAFVCVFIIGMLIGLPLPLTAVQILYVNLVTNGIMDVALATEPGHGDIMKQKPVRKGESILKWNVVPYLLLMAAVMVTLAIFTFQYYQPEGEEMARTGTFLIISMTQVFNVFNMRSLRKSIFEIGFFTNKWINIAFVAAILMQYLVVKIPFFQDLLGFTDFPTTHFLVITVISTSVIWFAELYKYLKFKKNLF